MKALLTITVLAALTAGCRSSVPASSHDSAPSPTPRQQSAESTGGSTDAPTHRALPRAVIYKTDGDYRDNVPVTLNAAGTALVSYPAPSDLTERSAPLQLADGYLLDRRGVSMNTRFTRYTYARYRKLDAAPSPATLIDSIIPGARVTELHRLNITPQQALSDTAAVNNLIRSSFRTQNSVQM